MQDRWHFGGQLIFTGLKQYSILVLVFKAYPTVCKALFYCVEKVVHVNHVKAVNAISHKGYIPCVWMMEKQPRVLSKMIDCNFILLKILSLNHGASLILNPHLITFAYSHKI